MDLIVKQKQQEGKCISRKKKSEVVGFLKEMKKRYQIQSRREGQILRIQVIKTAKNNGVTEKYHLDIRQNQLSLEALSLFQNYDHFCSYFRQNNNLVTFEPIQLSVVIQFPMPEQSKYLYLPINGQPIERQIKNIEIQLMAQKYACQLHNESLISSEQSLFSDYLQQIEWYNDKQKRACNLIKRQQTKIEETQKDILRLAKKSLSLDFKITEKLAGSKEEHTNPIKNEFVSEKEEQVYLHELIKIGNEQSAELMKKDPKTVTCIDFSKVGLKSMQFTALFICVSELRLSGNLIKNMKGMTNMQHLTILDLSNNNISQIQGLTNCLFLKQVILHTNKIAFISNIFHLAQLQLLSLSNNCITEIPNLIGKLQNLSQLRIINNSLKHLSSQLHNLKNLKVLSLLGNPCFSDSSKAKMVINKLVERGVETMNSIL